MFLDFEVNSRTEIFGGLVSSCVSFCLSSPEVTDVLLKVVYVAELHKQV